MGGGGGGSFREHVSFVMGSAEEKMVSSFLEKKTKGLVRVWGGVVGCNLFVGGFFCCV